MSVSFSRYFFFCSFHSFHLFFRFLTRIFRYLFFFRCFVSFCSFVGAVAWLSVVWFGVFVIFRTKSEKIKLNAKNRWALIGCHQPNESCLFVCEFCISVHIISSQIGDTNEIGDILCGSGHSNGAIYKMLSSKNGWFTEVYLSLYFSVAIFFFKFSFAIVGCFFELDERSLFACKNDLIGFSHAHFSLELVTKRYSVCSSSQIVGNIKTLQRLKFKWRGVSWHTIIDSNNDNNFAQ